MTKKQPRLILQFKDHAHVDAERQKIWNAVYGESPLACAVVGTAFLEAALAAILKAFFVESRDPTSNDPKDERTTVPTDVFDENNGFLAELSRKASLAFCLGLISSDAMYNAKKIARIRNLFAHTYEGLDFHTHDEIRRLCLSLRFTDFAFERSEGDDAVDSSWTIEDWLKRDPETGQKFHDEGCRTRFMLMVECLSILFSSTSLEVSHREQLPNGPEQTGRAFPGS
jgi:hypothetical protein